MALERTLAMIKPDAVAAGNVGNILAMAEAAGFRIVAMRMTSLTRQAAEAFYAVHRERPFFPPLCEFMSSGPIVALVLERENAIAAWRDLMGPTDSTVAPKDTVRGRYGKSKGENATHGSDAPETAAIEIPFFFPGQALV